MCCFLWQAFFGFLPLEPEDVANGRILRQRTEYQSRRQSINASLLVFKRLWCRGSIAPYGMEHAVGCR
jgi:hypothetical protein